MSVRRLLMSPPPERAWLFLAYPASPGDQLNSVAIDGPTHSVVFAGQTSSTTRHASTVKLTKAAAFTWARQLAGAFNGQAAGSSIALDAAGNVYVFGLEAVSGSSRMFVAQYDSTGALQWQKTFSGLASQFCGMTVDSSGNVYLSSWVTFSGHRVIKMDNTGAVLWGQQLTNGSDIPGYAVCVDSGGSVHSVGYENNSSPAFLGAFAVKYDASGVYQWQKVLYTTGQSRFVSCAVDASSNLFAAGHTTLSSIRHFLVAKYNSAGVLQWHRTYGNGTDPFEAHGVALDSDGNVYVAGYVDPAGGTKGIIIKYNTSGTLQWQRELKSTGANPPSPYLLLLACAFAGNHLIVAGYTYNSSDLQTNFAMKLPKDGTNTGSYTVDSIPITYGSVSFTDAAGTLTDDATAYGTDSSFSPTILAGTATDSALSLTTATKVI